MKTASIFNVVAATVAGFMGGTLTSHAPVQASSPQVVRASRFELVDSAGRALARWEVDPKTNNTHLCFLARGGGVGLDAGVFPDAAPFLLMNGRDGKNRITLVLDGFDKPELAMSDERWQGRLLLGHRGTDTPDIPDRTDEWTLEFHPFGSEMPVSRIGTTKLADGKIRSIFISDGEEIRQGR